MLLLNLDKASGTQHRHRRSTANAHDCNWRNSTSERAGSQWNSWACRASLNSRN